MKNRVIHRSKELEGKFKNSFIFKCSTVKDLSECRKLLLIFAAIILNCYRIQCGYNQRNDCKFFDNNHLYLHTRRTLRSSEDSSEHVKYPEQLTQSQTYIINALEYTC